MSSGPLPDTDADTCVGIRKRVSDRDYVVHGLSDLSRADKERSKVVFESQQVRLRRQPGGACGASPSNNAADTSQLHLDLFLPDNKRVTKSVTLFGPIDPSTSTFRILSTKVISLHRKSFKTD